MEDLAYDVVRGFFKLATSIFFREIRTTGSHLVPQDDPCIFIVAPHANQFIDPGMVLISNPRRFAPLMAESSFKRKVIGTGARLLKAIPVIRPQDLATKGEGTLRAKDSMTIIGTNTRFKHQVASLDLLSIGKSIKLEVDKVVSDTELVLKHAMSDQEMEALAEVVGYKVIPHVDQSTLYEEVHARLAESECIVIFPEGGSHDRSEMLPLKAGFAIMALGAMAKHKHLNVKIVPVGLNYFHPHRFRSRAVISYGAPITVERKWVDLYKQGGAAKREAIGALIEAGYNGLKSVTVNAPNYDTVLIIAAARRLYKPAAEHKLTLDQVVDLNRRFLLGYKHLEKDPRLQELARKVQAYNDTLKYFGLRDHQVERTKSAPLSVLPVLISRLVRLMLLSAVGFPSLLLNSPVAFLALTISRIKQRDALASSNVKLAARDVVATWKVLVVLLFAPAIYGCYSSLLLGYLYKTRLEQYGLSNILWLSLLSWVIQPFMHYIGIRLLETGVDIYKSLKPLILSVFEPDTALQLRKMRERLSEDITNFVNENGPSALSDFDPRRFDREKKKSSKAAAAKGMFDDVSHILQNWLGDDSALFNFTGHSSSSDEDSEA